ncbi:MAG TPA: two-component regulator propeller domain-containing protein [Bryobacteraceae bacterium]|nr:two-component regulator propeller domain-containing protein [Bryobacteraceae bacterium]
MSRTLSASGPTEYRVDSWNGDTGLPQNAVNRLTQTRDGYLWLATFAGLVRYDGARFQVFDRGNSPGMRTSRFLSLFEDHEGALWSVTEGQGVTRYRNGAFSSYTTADGLPDNNALVIFEDQAGRLFVDTDKGLAEFRNGRFVPAPASLPSENTFPGAVKLAGGRHGTAMWYLGSSGLHQRDENGIIRSVPSPPGEPVWIYEDRARRVWIEAMDRGSPRRHLYCYRDGRLDLFSERDGLPTSFRTMYGLDDRQGNVWFAFADGGLVRFRNGRFTHFTTTDGLPSNSVSSIYEDREGTLWVGTAAGLSRFTPRLLSSFSAPDGLASANVYPILQDRTAAVWIGSWPGLTKYENGVFTNVSAQYGMTKADVESMLEDREGGLWLGVWGGGVQRIQHGKAQQFDPHKPPGTVVRVMAQDSSGDIWFGGLSGLTRYHAGAFTAITPRDGFPECEVLSMLEDRRHALWIGHSLGVTRYADGKFTNYDERSGFAGHAVRALYDDADGSLWLGTYDTGLFRWEGGRFTQFTTRDGLFDNGVFQILEDRFGRFWLSCNRGIYRVSRAELNDVAEGRRATVASVAYGKEDGMASAECNGGAQPAGIKARDGRFWFPTQRGVVVFDPASISSNPLPPPVAIEEVLVDHQPYAPAGVIELAPHQTDLEIHYAGLTFVRPEATRFRYKLEPLDSQWVNAESRGVAYYSHLPYGRYRFQVIAANRDGVWSDQPSSIPVVVPAPVWARAWFHALAATALVSMAILFYRRRIAALRREQALQRAFSRQLIDSQEQERKRIAGELHDSLGQTLSIVKNRALVALGPDGTPDRLREQMEEIAAAATDALAEVSDIVRGLRPVELDRLGLTKAIAAMVKRVDASGDTHLTIDIDSLDGCFARPREIHVYRMAQEAVNNVVKHANASEAHIQIRRAAHAVELTIRDNGKGFATPAPQGGGLGLKNISERAESMGGSLRMDSVPGRGTTLAIRIPVQENGASRSQGA